MLQKCLIDDLATPLGSNRSTFDSETHSGWFVVSKRLSREKRGNVRSNHVNTNLRGGKIQIHKVEFFGLHIGEEVTQPQSVHTVHYAGERASF